MMFVASQWSAPRSNATCLAPEGHWGGNPWNSSEGLWWLRWDHHPFIYSLPHSFSRHSCSGCSQAVCKCWGCKVAQSTSHLPKSWVRNRSNSPGIMEAVIQTWRDREQGSCHCRHHRDFQEAQEVPGCQTRNSMEGENIPGHSPMSLPDHSTETNLTPGPDTFSLTPGSITNYLCMLAAQLSLTL